MKINEELEVMARAIYETSPISASRIVPGTDKKETRNISWDDLIYEGEVGCDLRQLNLERAQNAIQAKDRARVDRQVDDLMKLHNNAMKSAISRAEEMGLVFVNNQGNKCALNPAVVKKQNPSVNQIENIKKLHCEAYDLIEDSKTPTKTWEEYRAEMEAIEFEMQVNWNFEKDANYHTWWKKFPACTCPQMDNEDPIYYGRGKITLGNCPMHGGSL